MFIEGILIEAAALALKSYIVYKSKAKNPNGDSEKLKQYIDSLPKTEIKLGSLSIGTAHFASLIKKIEENNYFAIAKEIEELLNKYEKSDDLTSDFEKYVNALNLSSDQKDALISFMQDIRQNMESLIENIHSTNSKTNEILKAKGIPRKFYDKRIEGIYSKMTNKLREDYQELVKCCVLIYMDICALNYKLGIISKGEIDNLLIFMIAGRAKDKSGLICVNNKTVEQLAYDISEAIKKHIINP